jgi:hypothetical protein
MNKEYNVRFPDSMCINDPRIVENPTGEIEYPITIYMDLCDSRLNTCIAPVIKEAFDLISDKYTFIDTLPTGDKYELVSIYGEPCNINGASDNYSNIFPFLRELFLNKIDTTRNSENYKRIFIGRKNSFFTNNAGHSNPIRVVVNEEEFIERLSEYGIRCIYLEEYSFEEKLNIFNSAELIISTNSSALTCLLWCNINVKVIEIINKPVHCGNGNHFSLICNTLGLNYHRYSNIKDDENGNFIINNDDDIYKLIETLV